MRNIIYAILILGIFFTSCSESDSEVLSNVNLYLEENFAKNLDSVKFIVVIPEQGCGTCITQAENFYNEFSQNDDIVFVFCNIISNKILKHKVNINYDNTVFDYDNEFLSLLPQNKQIYPCVFVMKKICKFRIATAATLSALVLAGGLIYASPITSTGGCNNMTKEHNNGHCVSDGTNYFCANKKFLQSKDCEKHDSASAAES